MIIRTLASWAAGERAWLMSPFQGRFAAGCLFPLAILLGFPATAGEAQWPDLSAPPSSTGGGEDDAAVIVGIEGYTYVDPVPGAIGNAQDWYAWLTGTRRVPVGRIALLRDMDGTREEILAAAGRAAEQVGRGGTVWFVFVGHGAPSRDGHDGLLLGVDTMQKADSIYARGVVQQEPLDAMTAGT